MDNFTQSGESQTDADSPPACLKRDILAASRKRTQSKEFKIEVHVGNSSSIYIYSKMRQQGGQGAQGGLTERSVSFWTAGCFWSVPRVVLTSVCRVEAPFKSFEQRTQDHYV